MLFQSPTRIEVNIKKLHRLLKRVRPDHLHRTVSHICLESYAVALGKIYAGGTSASDAKGTLSIDFHPLICSAVDN